VRYITEDGYKYTTDDLGRIVDIEAGELILQKGKRNKGMQVAAGREDRLPDDDGGHLIGTQFHGSGDIDNGCLIQIIIIWNTIVKTVLKVLV